jgi:hypothetical protein
VNARDLQRLIQRYEAIDAADPWEGGPTALRDASDALIRAIARGEAEPDPATLCRSFERRLRRYNEDSL